MERPVKGDIVVVPFPFSDLTASKRRPALVITSLKGNDVILSQITSINIRDSYSIALSDSDFKDGNLKVASNVRPNRLFTADKNIILYKIGHLNRSSINAVIDKIIKIIKQ